MAVEVASAYITLMPSMRGFKRSVEGELRGMGDLGGKGGEEYSRGFASKDKSSLGKWAKRGLIATGVAIGAGIGSAITGGMNRMMNIEDAEAKLKGLGHTGEDISAIMDDALKSVKGTAFGLDEAATQAATAVAAGVKPGKELADYLTLVGDAATIGGTSLDEMGAIFGKVQTSGRAYTQELQQLADRGIPIFQWLQEEYGVTAEELRKMVSDGQVDAETYFRVIDENIGGAALEAGNTTRGALRNLGAAWSRFGAELLSGVFPLFKDGIKWATDWADRLTEKVAPAVEWVQTAFTGLRDLLVRGDFTSAFRNAFGVEEDAWVVGFLLNVREGVEGLYKLFTNQGTGQLAKWLDVPQDHPAIGFLQTVRDFVTESIPAGVQTLKDIIEGVFKVITEQGTGKLAQALGVDQDHWAIQGLLFTKDKIEELANFVLNTAIPNVATFFEEFQTGEGKAGDLRAGLEFLNGEIEKLVVWVRDELIPRLREAWEWMQEHETTILGVTAVIAGWYGTYVVLATGIAAAKGAIELLTGAQLLLNGAMAANPLGLIIVLLAALTTAFIIAYNESDTFREHVDTAMWSAKTVTEWYVDWLRDDGVYHIAAAWSTIEAIFESGATAIGWAWDRVVALTAKPILLTMAFVNQGIVNPINKVLDWANVPKNMRVPVMEPSNELVAAANAGNRRRSTGAASSRYAMASGGILPGYSPGVDDYFFTGDKFNLALAGGEAIMRPEWTRAVGKDFIDSMNAAARSGGVDGVRKAMGFASGGIIPDEIWDWGKDKIAAGKDWAMDKIEAGKNLASNVLDFLRDPEGYLREKFNTSRLAGNPFLPAMSGAVKKIIPYAAEKLLGFWGGDGSDNQAVNYGGRFGWHPTGMPWGLIWNRIKAAAPEAVMTSNFRPGAITASGITSLHSLGRAVDVVSNNMRATFEKIRPLMKWSQLYYTPMGGRQIGYRDSIVAATHWDHIHAAFAKGGIMPNLYDNGGWLQPGVSLVSNKTGKPEAVFTDEQLQQFGGDTNITLYGIPMDAAGETADEILYQMRRVRHGKYAHKR